MQGSERLSRCLCPGAVYVCTEDTFPDRRLQQLIPRQAQLRADVPADVVRKIRFGSQIFVEHAADVVRVAQQAGMAPAENRHGRRGA